MPMYGKRLKQNNYYGYHSMPYKLDKYVNKENRQQPSPVMQDMNGMVQPYFHVPNMNPYLNQQSFPVANPNFQATQGYPNSPMPVQYPQQSSYSPAQTIFQNPLQVQEDYYGQQQNSYQQNTFPMMNPYPKASFIQKPPSGVKSVMNSFKAQDGSLDLNKMVDTAGQMMNAVSQVSSVVKGLGGMFKV